MTTILTILTTVYGVFAPIVMAVLGTMITDKHIGYHYSGSKMEHPTHSLYRFFGNVAICVIGGLIFPIVWIPLLYYRWRQKMDEYREAQGLYKEIDNLEVQIEEFQVLNDTHFTEVNYIDDIVSEVRKRGIK